MGGLRPCGLSLARGDLESKGKMRIRFGNAGGSTTVRWIEIGRISLIKGVDISLYSLMKGVGISLNSLIKYTLLIVPRVDM